MNARTPSLARRITLAMTGVAALSVALVFIVFYVAWNLYTVDVAAAELAKRLPAVAAGVEAGSKGGRLFRIEARLLGARLVVVDPAGTVRFASDPTQRALRIPVDRLGRREGSVRWGVRDLPGAGTGRLVIAATPLADGGWLVALRPVREIGQVTGWVLAILAGCALLAVGAAWLLARWLAERITAPLTRLRIGAGAVTAGDWGHQVPVESADEVGALATAFNAMSSRVAAAYAAQRDFVGDVGHELRTPITSIQGFAEALVDGTVTDSEARTRYLGVIRDEAVRLGELTRTLLALADLEAGAVAVARAPVDAAALTEALAARYAERAAAAGIELAVDVPAGALGDPDRLLQALTILVDNALAHTPMGGSVSVAAAAAAPGRWAVAVDDTGPGIPAAQREAVFGRFRRLDPSRAQATGGSGLGLAICARVVALMDGTVRADDGARGGARFVIDLPAAPRG